MSMSTASPAADAPQSKLSGHGVFFRQWTRQQERLKLPLALARTKSLVGPMALVVQHHSNVTIAGVDIENLAGNA
jgi:hypothetical protein